MNANAKAQPQENAQGPFVVPSSIKPLHFYGGMQPMEPQVGEFLFNLMLNKELGATVYDDMQKDELFHFMVGVKRAEVLEIKLSKAVMVMIAIVSRGPGAVILYLHAVHQKQLRLKEMGEDRDVEITDFCEMFPMGFPDEETMTRAWDAQKDLRPDVRGPDNLLDMAHIFKAYYSDPQL